MERYSNPLIASVTLGLAPFVPEPHIIGKVRWVLGGGVGMSVVDWGDFLMHGAPWAWLIGTAVVHGFSLLKPTKK